MQLSEYSDICNSKTAQVVMTTISSFDTLVTTLVEIKYTIEIYILNIMGYFKMSLSVIFFFILDLYFCNYLTLEPQDHNPIRSILLYYT